MSTAISTHRETPMNELAANGDQAVKTGMLPDHIKTGWQFAVIAATGHELGMQPMRAIRSLAMVKGKVVESADSQLARFKAAGGRSQFEVLDETKAVLHLIHPNGDKHTESFTIEDAKRAGLSSNSNYSKFPKAMLRSRAITAGLKSVGWEGAVGAYDPDELRSEEFPERTYEPAKEPAMIRPQGQPAKPLTNTVKAVAPGITVAHVERFEPQATAVAAATAGDMERSRLAVNKAAKVGDLEKMQTLTEQRLKTGFYTPAQADELLNLINGKLDILTSEPEDRGQEFTHEAAEHEVQA
jgi:hypothetical protein